MFVGILRLLAGTGLTRCPAGLRTSQVSYRSLQSMMRGTTTTTKPLYATISTLVYATRGSSARRFASAIASGFLV